MSNFVIDWENPYSRYVTSLVAVENKEIIDYCFDETLKYDAKIRITENETAEQFNIVENDRTNSIHFPLKYEFNAPVSECTLLFDVSIVDNGFGPYILYVLGGAVNGFTIIYRTTPNIFGFVITENGTGTEYKFAKDFINEEAAGEIFNLGFTFGDGFISLYVDGVFSESVSVTTSTLLEHISESQMIGSSDFDNSYVQLYGTGGQDLWSGEFRSSFISLTKVLNADDIAILSKDLKQVVKPTVKTVANDAWYAELFPAPAGNASATGTLPDVSITSINGLAIGAISGIATGVISDTNINAILGSANAGTIGVAAGSISDSTVSVINGLATGAVAGISTGTLPDVSVNQISGSANAGSTGTSAGTLADLSISNVTGLATGAITGSGVGQVSDVLTINIKGSASAGGTGVAAGTISTISVITVSGVASGATSGVSSGTLSDITVGNVKGSASAGGTGVALGVVPDSIVVEVKGSAIGGVSSTALGVVPDAQVTPITGSASSGTLGVAGGSISNVLITKVNGSAFGARAGLALASFPDVLITPVSGAASTPQVVTLEDIYNLNRDIHRVLGLDTTEPVVIGNGKYLSTSLDIDVIDNTDGTYTLSRN